jgi:hypothetical protein
MLLVLAVDLTCSLPKIAREPTASRGQRAAKSLGFSKSTATNLSNQNLAGNARFDSMDSIRSMAASKLST